VRVRRSHRWYVLARVVRRPRARVALERVPMPMKRLTDARRASIRAGVPRRTAVAAASTVGAVGSLTTLALAYREPLNRCRCDATTSESEEPSRDESAAAEEDGAATKTPRKKKQSRFRAHCAKCRKRTNVGVAMSFLFSPLYVGVASGITAAAAHLASRAGARFARGLAADARARFTTAARASS